MIRDIEVSVDQTSWRGAVPSDIQNLVGVRPTEIIHGLFHTALRTRPPTSHGFHLSDLWAWLRYGPAFASTPDLRLRAEWSDVDPHQKTVMSDELGMGLTTQLLAEELGFCLFANTLEYCQVDGPGRVHLIKSKHGQGKSPDFIATDSKLRTSVIECKGTQSSRSALRKAMRTGRAQKQNVALTASQRIRHSLVVGLFIPQATSPQKALIRLADPDWQEIDAMLSDRDPSQVARSIVQVVLAKHMALIGMFTAANFLGSTLTEELRVLPDLAREELSQRGQANSEGRVVIEPRPAESLIPAAAGGLGRPLIDGPELLFERILSSADLRVLLDELVAEVHQRRWPRLSEDAAAPFRTTLDFGFRFID